MTKYSINFYNGIKKITNSLLYTLYIPEVHGIENIPTTTPYILAGNHKSLWDIPFLACSIIEPVRFMAKEELFKSKISAHFLYKLGAFPVNRNGADLKAIKNALAVLKNEEVLGIFPEGTRSKKEMLPFKAGTTLISKKTKALIVPFGISGDYKFRQKIYLNFGIPINVAEIDGNPEEYLQEKVKKLIVR